MDIRQRYQIFRKLNEKVVFWVEDTSSLDDAKRRVKERTKMSPDEHFFIFDAENERFIVPEEDEPG